MKSEYEPVDFPFEKTEVVAQFMDNANSPKDERMKIASDNAKRIHHLDSLESQRAALSEVLPILFC